MSLMRLYSANKKTKIKKVRTIVTGVLTLIMLMTGLGSLHAQHQQRGKASYYSRRANGARTSSGERLNNDSLVCAHRTYPFGTMLKVTNLVNDKWTVVRVIDRGPFTRGRVIDLSYAAAKELGMLAQGVASVLVEPADEVVIPFRFEKKSLMPEVDFELNEGGSDSIPIWHDYNKLKATMKPTIKHKKMTPKR